MTAVTDQLQLRYTDRMKFRKRHLWWLLVPVMASLLLAGFQFSLFFGQQAAIQQIEKLGGRVVTTHGDPRWIRWLIGGKSLRIFEHATVVNLSQNKVEDADLIHLRNLNGLQRLNLNETRITDDGLQYGFTPVTTYCWQRWMMMRPGSTSSRFPKSLISPC